MNVTRLAPSPTGYLHLGNARTFLINWAIARQRGWRVLLRIEDLDYTRVQTDAAKAAMDTLRWLGIDWDGEPLLQSADLTPYQSALQQLAAEGKCYPCRATRAQIAAAAASAPHGNGNEPRYPGICRPKEPTPTTYKHTKEDAVAWRLRTDDETIHFEDQLLGPQTSNPYQSVGDFLIATKAGMPGYQLAVVVDDARQGVTDVIRGDDLLTSAARQLLVYQALGLHNTPRYWHVSLVYGPDGRRLAKRHGDTRIDAYRERGVSPHRVIGLLAEWSSAGPRREMSAKEFLANFELNNLSTAPITFHPADDAWLLQA